MELEESYLNKILGFILVYASVSIIFFIVGLMVVKKANATDIQLTWTHDDTASMEPTKSFVIEWTQDNILWTVVNSENGPGRRTLSISDLLDGQYNFRVKACNAISCSGFVMADDPLLARSCNPFTPNPPSALQIKSNQMPSKPKNVSFHCDPSHSCGIGMPHLVEVLPVNETLF